MESFVALFGLKWIHEECVIRFENEDLGFTTWKLKDKKMKSNITFIEFLEFFQLISNYSYVPPMETVIIISFLLEMSGVKSRHQDTEANFMQTTS